jgi:hypothetical protein
MRTRALVFVLIALVTPAYPQAPAAAADPYTAELALDPDNAFLQFAVAQSARRTGTVVPALATSRDSTRWQLGIYELTTGAAAIQESLQLDRLAGGGDEVQPPTVPLASIEGVVTPAHDYGRLARTNRPVVEALAAAVPADWYYAHASGMTQMRRVLGAADIWGTHLLNMYSLSARDSRVKERLERQLLLQTNPQLDGFYNLVVSELAVTGSDPFLREGSDVTVLFGLRNTLLFKNHIAGARTNAVAADSSAAVSSEQRRSWTIEGLSTPDRRIASFVAIGEGFAAVSNSIVALRQVLDVHDDPIRSLGTASDFRYMRSIYPYDEAREDAFLYLSDGFVRRVVSPRLKIGEARRVRCAVSLQTAAFGDLLFRTEMRRPPAGLDELLESKYLDAASLRCPDGGRYRIEGGIAYCSIHNRLTAMTPNLELRLDAVAENEAEAYRQFREGYDRYWRRYIDPVGIRMRMREALEVETTILPLVENSAYNGLRGFAGGEPVELARPQGSRAVLTLDMKTPRPGAGKPVEDDRWLGMHVGSLFGKGLGGWMSFQVLDGKPSVATNMIGLAPTPLIGSVEDYLAFGPLLVSLVLPTVAIAPVADRAAVERALEELRAYVGRESQRRGGWDDLFHIEGYELVEGGAPTVEAVSLRLLVFQLRIYYGIVGDRLVASTDRALFEEVGKALATGAGTGNLRLELAPGRWQELRASLAQAYAEDSRSACLVNTAWVRILSRALGKLDRGPAEASLDYLGAVLVCPDGGVYGEPRTGEAVCTIHGSRAAPRQGPRPQPGSSAAFVLDRVSRMEATLSFTEEGVSTRVRIE